MPHFSCEVVTRGAHGYAETGDYGVSTVGDHGTAITGPHGTAISGRHSESISGINGTSITGDDGKARTGVGGRAKAGKKGWIVIDYVRNGELRYRIAKTDFTEVVPNIFYIFDVRVMKLVPQISTLVTDIKRRKF